MNEIIIGLVALLLGVAIGWGFFLLRARTQSGDAGTTLAAAQSEVQNILRDARASAQEQTLKAREDLDREIRERRQEASETDRRLAQREATLDRKAELLDRKSEETVKKELAMVDRERELHKLQGELDELKRLSQLELQRLAGLNAEQAKAMLLSQLEDEVKTDATTMARRLLENARENAEREARRVIGIAVERCASNHVQTATTCTLTLPSEEMKGRIIGREGRNIRAFEAATGINVLIDDTPQAVVLSGFDPVRREVAKITLERLVTDGRINPARIEEEVVKVRTELEETIRQAGEEAIARTGVVGIHPDMVRMLGRLKFRHSYAQNVLDHSVEVSHLAGMIAAEMGLNQQLAKRIGLFHDVGKAVDHEVEGSHASIGASLLKKYGEPDEVCQAVASHHHETEVLTIYGTLTSAADAISASRPGARSESMELYVQRLEKLETLASGFPGVEKSYALQAGREIRVMVRPDKILDGEAIELARQIARKIEQELQYPGQIKVSVVRETRVVEYAK
jgi:ribonuclease Y